MSAERLLQQFDRIAEAPDAVAHLRRFILDLAVRGKLVDQDPNDEPASELLKRIQFEKKRLVNKGEIKQQKSLPPIAVENEPFPIPRNWCWTKLNELTSYMQRGKSPKYAISDGLPVISQKCVQWQGLGPSAARIVTKESIESYEKIRFLQDGDLLWNSTGTGTIGRIIRLKAPQEKLICDSHVTVVRYLEVEPEFIRIWLRSDRVYGVIESKATGATNQVELTAQMTTNQAVPLPPLAEQHRIVAKVDELMGLCDQLETQLRTTPANSRCLLESLLHKAIAGTP
jgi:type I restriction enzyme, S subunit